VVAYREQFQKLLVTQMAVPEVCNFVGLWMHIFSQSRGGVKMTLRQLAAAQLALIMGVVATAASTGSSSCFALPATATDAGAFAANENVQL
jgi:hypothetical protein